jgi:hypothetical protein
MPSRRMQQTIFLTLVSSGWITCATSLPDSLLSASVAKNDNQLLGASGLTTVVTALSGYLTTSYYDDENCKTLKYADGVELGACEYLSSNDKYRVTTADQDEIRIIYYNDKDCSIVNYQYNTVAYTDGACTASLTAYRVSASRNVLAQGIMKRSISQVCS